jgi:hypothetical protein
VKSASGRRTFVRPVAECALPIVLSCLVGMVACHDDGALDVPGVGGFDALDVGTQDGAAFDVAPSDVAPDSAASDPQGACFEADDAGSWTTLASVDPQGCEMRPLAVCGASGASMSERLHSHLLEVARECGLRPYTYVQVSFVAGCPSSLRARDAIGRPIPAGLSPCLVEALKIARWDCAIGLPCATAEYDTLP